MERETKETRITCVVGPGKGVADVRFDGITPGTEPRAFDKADADGDTTDLVPQGGRARFMQHMLETLAKWSGFDITLHVTAKDGIEHHAIEDGAIALGKALRACIDTGAIERTATHTMPMDDALVLVSLDLVERPYYEGRLPDPLMEHIFRSLATEAGFTLHIVRLRGRDPHHITEAAFKGLAMCLRDATRPRAERLSTKGRVEVR